VYEANEESTFVLLAPLRSRAEARRAAPIPRAIRELRGIYGRATTELYVLMPALSHQAPAVSRKSQSSVAGRGSQSASAKPSAPKPHH
jgi:hypothetical protein